MFEAPARALRAFGSVVTPTGRAVILLAIAAFAGSRYTHLVELRLIALMCALAVLLAIPWLLLSMRVRASLSLRPPRAVAGESVDVTLTAKNEGRLSLWQPLVNLPVGKRSSWLRLPTLAAGETGSHDTTIDKLERGVVDVGPAVAIRTDPLGLLRRSVSWGEPIELYVRPRMALLSTLGSGQVRDLEGVPSDRMSMSDLAFHALREYVPGDDLRHVHWRSSARAGELLVRQYHDTRRNHATLVLDPSSTAYLSDDEYELGVSIAASLIMCAAQEEYDVSLLSGREQVTAVPPSTVLDATSRVQRDAAAGSLSNEVAQALVLAPETSLLFLITGAAIASLDELTAAVVAVPAETRCVVLRAAVGEQTTVLSHHGFEVVVVGSLAELPAAMAAST